MAILAHSLPHWHASPSAYPGYSHRFRLKKKNHFPPSLNICHISEHHYFFLRPPNRPAKLVQNKHSHLQHAHVIIYWSLRPTQIFIEEIACIVWGKESRLPNWMEEFCWGKRKQTLFNPARTKIDRTGLSRMEKSQRGEELSVGPFFFSPIPWIFRFHVLLFFSDSSGHKPLQIRVIAPIIEKVFFGMLVLDGWWYAFAIRCRWQMTTLEMHSIESDD